jgi:hypothetical protein
MAGPLVDHILGGEFEFRVAASAIVGGFNPAEKNATIVVIQYMSCWLIVVVVIIPSKGKITNI